MATTTSRRSARAAHRAAWAETETKPFFMTSEFLFYALMTLALLITAVSDDSIDARWFWLLEVPLTIGYLLSPRAAPGPRRSAAASAIRPGA